MASLKTCVATPVLECVLNFMHEGFVEKSVVVKEGDLLKGLVYVDTMGETKTIDGIVKAINFVSKSVSTGKDNCIHDDESVFSKYVTIDSLVIDYSDKYDCNVIKMPIKSIKDVSSVEEVLEEGVVVANPENFVEVLAAAPAGATIKLAAGNYGTLEFGENPASDLTILGSGDVSVDKVEFYAQNNKNSKCPDNLTLKNIIFNGYGINATKATTSGLTIDSCVFAENAVIRLANKTVNTNLTVKNCLFNGGVDDSMSANTVYAPFTTGAVVEGNIFKNSDFNPFNCTDGSVDGEIVIKNNKVYDSFSRAFRFAKAVETAKFFVSGNVMSNINVDGKSYEVPELEWFKVSHSVSGVTIEIGNGNTLDGKVIAPETIVLDETGVIAK